eukprot:g4171.t1
MLLVFLSTAWLARRRLQYSRKYTVIKLGERRCCTHRWRLDFPRQSRFSRLDVAEGAKLGNGAFGEVNQGTLQVGKATLRIAVKHVLESKATDVQRHDTIVECRLQCELDWPFLVKCFGFTTGPGPGDFSILLELMDIGDLPRYMESVVKNQGGRIAEATRLRWMIEIASALEYMHASNLIHADLAARNLVLYHSKTGIGCKVTDFGLSHSIDPNTKAYMLPYGGSVPFHWTAPECLPCDANFVDVYGSSGSGGGSNGRAGNSAAGRVLQLTPANDVWAFGVTVWEIEGLAANGILVKPFKDVPNEDLYEHLSTKKAKLEFKFRCHDKIVDTFKDPAEVALKSCLRVRPWARTTMADIRRRLQAAALTDAAAWEQDDIHKWLDRMGAPRVDGADLWEREDYDYLMSEILNDDNRPDYMAELKDDMDDDDILPLSARLRAHPTFSCGVTPNGERLFLSALLLAIVSAHASTNASNTCSHDCEQRFIRECLRTALPGYAACRQRLDAGNLTGCAAGCADTPWMEQASLASPGFAAQCPYKCTTSFIRICLGTRRDTYRGYEACRADLDNNVLPGCEGFAGCNDTVAMRMSRELRCGDLKSATAAALPDAFDACMVTESALIKALGPESKWAWIFQSDFCLENREDTGRDSDTGIECCVADYCSPNDIANGVQVCTDSATIAQGNWRIGRVRYGKPQVDVSCVAKKPALKNATKRFDAYNSTDMHLLYDLCLEAINPWQQNDIDYRAARFEIRVQGDEKTGQKCWPCDLDTDKRVISHKGSFVYDQNSFLTGAEVYDIGKEIHDELQESTRLALAANSNISNFVLVNELVLNFVGLVDDDDVLQPSPNFSHIKPLRWPKSQASHMLNGDGQRGLADLEGALIDFAKGTIAELGALGNI